MSDYQQTFGPVVIEWDDEPNKLVAKCQSGRFDCKGRVALPHLPTPCTLQCPACAKLSGVLVDPSSPEFINTFMRPAKTKAARHKRTMVVLNAQRMINEGAFQ
jgi:hypothetical protein